MEETDTKVPTRRRFLRSTAAAAVAVVALLVVASGAEASFISRQTSFARVSGYVTVHADRTNWGLSVTRTGGTRCVYAKVVVDRNNWPDPSIRSSNACTPYSPINFYGVRDYSYTRGAKVVLCQDIPWWPDSCSQVWYEPEL